MKHRGMFLYSRTVRGRRMFGSIGSIDFCADKLRKSAPAESLRIYCGITIATLLLEDGVARMLLKRNSLDSLSALSRRGRMRNMFS